MKGSLKSKILFSKYLARLQRGLIFLSFSPFTLNITKPLPTSRVTHTTYTLKMNKRTHINTRTSHIHTCLQTQYTLGTIKDTHTHTQIYIYKCASSAHTTTEKTYIKGHTLNNFFGLLITSEVKGHSN